MSPTMLTTDWVIVSPTYKERSRRPQKVVKEPAKPTPTIDLPSEIRMQIYRYALSSPEPFNLLETENGLRLAHIYQPRYPWSRFYLAKQLLLVSRKTYEEAADILYGENTFRFVYDMKTIQQLLEKLLPSTRSCIKRIDFQGAGSLGYLSPAVDAYMEQLCGIRKTLATQHSDYRLQCMGFDAPSVFSLEDGQHNARLMLALKKLFLLRMAKTIKFSGSLWLGSWDDRGFARLVEGCLDEQGIAGEVSRVVEDDTFSQQRSSVVVTFVEEKDH